VGVPAGENEAVTSAPFTMVTATHPC
jgi:hypothetical protein